MLQSHQQFPPALEKIVCAGSLLTLRYFLTVLPDGFRQNAQENCQNARKNAPA